MNCIVLLFLVVTPSAQALFANYTGDVVLGALFPIHAHDINTVCGEILQEDGIQMLEMMMYTLDQINNDPDFLPGFTIGAIALDSCDSDAYALEQTLEFIKVLVTKLTNGDDVPYTCPGGQPAKLKQGGVDFHKVVGVLGGSTSSVTIQVANLLRLFKVPQISYLATSPDLSNQERFDYFQRTVPSDTSQAKALLEIIRKFGWTYVSAVYEDSNYGLKGFGELEKLAEEAKICFAVREKIQLDKRPDDKYYDNIVASLLSKPRAKGVVIFADFPQVDALFKAANRSDVLGGRDFIWIGSDGWSGRYFVNNDGLARVANGALTVQPLALHLEGFDQYFKSLNPISNVRNPWFTEFWEEHFVCSFLSSYQRYPIRCIGTERIGGRWSNYHQNTHAHFVKDAVYAFAYALRDMHRDVCPNITGLCAEMEPERLKGETLLKYIKKVNFTDPISQEQIYFVNGVDAPARYTVLHFKETRTKQGTKYGWHSIGSYSDVYGESMLKLNTDFLSRIHTYPESICSRPCLAGQKRIYPDDGKVKCCWFCADCTDMQYMTSETECKPCKPGSKPNQQRTGCIPVPEEYMTYNSPSTISVCTFASFGILLTLAISVVFFIFRDTPVIKASGRELSTVLLAGIFISYAVTFAFVAKPSPFTCGLARFFLGFCYTVCYAAILTKTNRIARIFNHTKGGSPKKTRYTDPGSQLVITVILVAVQVVILTIWLIAVPPKVSHLYPDVTTNILQCDGADGLIYLVALIYPFILVVACTVYAIKTRKTPDGFNETQLIGFSNYTTCVIWLAFVPLYFTSSNYNTRTVTLCLSVALSGTVQLACLFIPKMYIVLFRPQKNTRDAVMAKTRSNSKVNSQNSYGASHIHNHGLTDNQSTSGLGMSLSSLATNNISDSRISVVTQATNSCSPSDLPASMNFGNGRSFPYHLSQDNTEIGGSLPSTPELGLNNIKVDIEHQRTHSPDSGCNEDFPKTGP